jgi:hypothetical protein
MKRWEKIIEEKRKTRPKENEVTTELARIGNKHMEETGWKNPMKVCVDDFIYKFTWCDHSKTRRFVRIFNEEYKRLGFHSSLLSHDEEARLLQYLTEELSR